MLWKLSVRSVANHTMTFFWDQRGSKMKLLDSHEDGYGQGSTTKASSHRTVRAKSLKKVHILERDIQALPSSEKHPKMKIVISTIFIYLSLRLHYFISIFRAP